MRDDQHPFIDMAAALGWEITLTRDHRVLDATVFGDTRSKTYLSGPIEYRLTINNHAGDTWQFKGDDIDQLKAKALKEMLR